MPFPLFVTLCGVSFCARFVYLLLLVVAAGCVELYSNVSSSEFQTGPAASAPPGPPAPRPGLRSAAVAQAAVAVLRRSLPSPRARADICSFHNECVGMKSRQLTSYLSRERVQLSLRAYPRAVPPQRRGRRGALR